MDSVYKEIGRRRRVGRNKPPDNIKGRPDRQRKRESLKLSLKVYRIVVGEASNLQLLVDEREREGAAQGFVRELNDFFRRCRLTRRLSSGPIHQRPNELTCRPFFSLFGPFSLDLHNTKKEKEKRGTNEPTKKGSCCFIDFSLSLASLRDWAGVARQQNNQLFFQGGEDPNIVELLAAAFHSFFSPHRL
jgi:hypothetical protein